MRFIVKRDPGVDRRHDEFDADAGQSPEVVHFLPCKILKRKRTVDDEQTLTAPVDRYFHPYSAGTATAKSYVKTDLGVTTAKANSVDTTAVKSYPVDATAKADTANVTIKADSVDTTKLWNATFRGKPLTGIKLEMPNGFVGVMCSVSNNKGNQDSVSDVDLTVDSGVTQELMFWNWDRVPTREDPLLTAFDWLPLSEAMMANN